MFRVPASLFLIALMCQVSPANCETTAHLHKAEPHLPNIDLRTLYVLMNQVINELKDFKSSTNDAFLHIGTQLRSQDAVLKNHGDILGKHDQKLDMLVKRDTEESAEINKNSKAIEDVTMLKDDIKNITRDVRVVKRGSDQG